MLPARCPSSTSGYTNVISSSSSWQTLEGVHLVKGGVGNGIAVHVSVNICIGVRAYFIILHCHYVCIVDVWSNIIMVSIMYVYINWIHALIKLSSLFDVTYARVTKVAFSLCTKVFIFMVFV